MIPLLGGIGIILILLFLLSAVNLSNCTICKKNIFKKGMSNRMIKNTNSI
jgi:hypothetical protein